MKLNLSRTILFISVCLTCCLSPSDKQHYCNCDYDDYSKPVIIGLNNFSDIELGQKCDQKCGFKRLLILFYDSSDSSKRTIELIESNPTLINDINDNFAFVCLLTDNSNENIEFQQKRFGTNKRPFFAVMTSYNDSLISSFGYLDRAEKIDSSLIRTLY